MDLYYPNRTGSTRALVAFNFLAYIGFAVGTVYLSFIIVRQAISAPTPGHLAILLFPIAFLVALRYWGSGTLDLLTSHFRVSVSDGKLHFDYVGRPFRRREEIMLDQITDVAVEGNAKPGVWITLRTAKRRYRLGHLLDPVDAARIIETTEKGKAT